MRIIQDLKRDESEIASLRGRSRIIFLIISILILSGIFKIVQLTVFDQSEYVTVSDKNRIINLPLFPSRGLIQLQDGTIIAENIVHQDIFIVEGSIDSSKDQIEFLYRNVLENKIEIDLSNNNLEKKIWLARSLNETELAKYELYKSVIPDIKLETSLRRYFAT